MEEQIVNSMNNFNLNDNQNYYNNVQNIDQKQEQPKGKSFLENLHDDPSWISPNPQQIKEMVDLLDMYFSDENLQKDKFLLKHVRRNKAGYVSVKLLTSFKKLKYLSKTDWRVTAFAITKSQNLELNHEGTKVKRKEPIPQINMPTTSIKTLLIKLPDDDVKSIPDYGIEEISPKLRGFGRLNSAKIVRPGESLPAELRNHTGKHQELGQSYCAVVEFEKTEDCQIAYRILSRTIRAYKLANDPNRQPYKTIDQNQLNRSLSNPNDGNNSDTTTQRLYEDEDDEDFDQKAYSKMSLPDSVKIEDICGWQVSLLGSGRNPRRHNKKFTNDGMFKSGYPSGDSIMGVGIKGGNGSRIRHISDSIAYQNHFNVNNNVLSPQLSDHSNLNYDNYNNNYNLQQQQNFNNYKQLTSLGVTHLNNRNPKLQCMPTSPLAMQLQNFNDNSNLTDQVLQVLGQNTTFNNPMSTTTTDDINVHPTNLGMGIPIQNIGQDDIGKISGANTPAIGSWNNQNLIGSPINNNFQNVQINELNQNRRSIPVSQNLGLSRTSSATIPENNTTSMNSRLNPGLNPGLYNIENQLPRTRSRNLSSSQQLQVTAINNILQAGSPYNVGMGQHDQICGSPPIIQKNSNTYNDINDNYNYGASPDINLLNNQIQGNYQLGTSPLDSNVYIDSNVYSSPINVNNNISQSTDQANQLNILNQAANFIATSPPAQLQDLLVSSLGQHNEFSNDQAQKLAELAVQQQMIHQHNLQNQQPSLNIQQFRTHQNSGSIPIHQKNISQSFGVGSPLGQGWALETPPAHSLHVVGSPIGIGSLPGSNSVQLHPQFQVENNRNSSTTISQLMNQPNLQQKNNYDGSQNNYYQ